MIVSDAFVVVPGGIGTLLELSLAWQLLQVRKLYNTPLILSAKCGPNWLNGDTDRCFGKAMNSPARSISQFRIV